MDEEFPLAVRSRKILIKAADVEISAQLHGTPTADRIWAVLPIRAVVQTWGDEIYFETHVETGREPDARAIVAPGELAFWPEGDAIAIGFGPTPISVGDEIRLAAPCNIWARTDDDVRQLSSVKAGDLIEVEKLEDD